MHHLKTKYQSESRSVFIITTFYARLFYTLWSLKMPLQPSHLFLTYCRIDILRVLRQSFYGKFQILCGFWNPANPAFRMYDFKTDLFSSSASLLLRCSSPLENPFLPDSPRYLQTSSPHSSHTSEYVTLSRQQLPPSSVMH